MALTVTRRLLLRSCVQPGEVGMLQISSSSLLDRSKCLKSVLTSLLESDCSDVEGVDHCGHSPTLPLLSCVDWVRGEGWDGRWALAVASESSGSGAVAAVALLAANLELRLRGT